MKKFLLAYTNLYDPKEALIAVFLAFLIVAFMAFLLFF